MANTIGLTGNIAMGKTTVSNYLADRKGLTVLDADLYARVAVQPGCEILQRIRDRHSEAILLPDGSLDRAKLGQIIFQDASERQWLEAQIHPFVRDQMIHDRDRALQTNPDTPVVLVIPLLFEAGLSQLVEEIWVVTCPADQQLERLMQRNSLTQAEAQNRIASQMPIGEKIAQADVVLNNSSTPEYLLAQVDRALLQCEESSREKNSS
jgi:dephospho-CoA kinase